MEEERGVASKSITDALNAALPQYIAMGMTPEQFWHGDTADFAAYREAYRVRNLKANEDAWLTGYYVLMALAATAPLAKRRPEYPKEPLPLYEPPKAAEGARASKQQEANKRNLEAFKRRFRARHGEEEGEPGRKKSRPSQEA